MQRTEEVLAAGTRELEDGQLKVRKRVRTDREQIEVPTHHEKASVERMPVEGEATEAEIGDDEVVVPLTEEEVVVGKRAVAKEEVRKDVVEGTETVEEDGVVWSICPSSRSPPGKPEAARAREALAPVLIGAILAREPPVRRSLLHVLQGREDTQPDG